MHQPQTEHVHTIWHGNSNKHHLFPHFPNLSFQMLSPTFKDSHVTVFLQDILRGTWRSTFLVSFNADLFETFRWLRCLSPRPGWLWADGWIMKPTEAGNKLDHRPNLGAQLSIGFLWPRKLRATRPTKEKTRNQQVALLQRVVLELKSYDETRRSRTHWDRLTVFVQCCWRSPVKDTQMSCSTLHRKK